MYAISQDAKEAVEELSSASATAELPRLTELVVKLEYEFQAQWFHGNFWLRVANDLGMTKRKRRESCGHGHRLFFHIRQHYRKMRDFSDKAKRSSLTPEELKFRRDEVLRFCSAIARVEL